MQWPRVSILQRILNVILWNSCNQWAIMMIETRRGRCSQAACMNWICVVVRRPVFTTTPSLRCQLKASWRQKMQRSNGVALDWRENRPVHLAFSPNGNLDSGTQPLSLRPSSVLFSCTQHLNIYQPLKLPHCLLITVIEIPQPLISLLLGEFGTIIDFRSNTLIGVVWKKSTGITNCNTAGEDGWYLKYTMKIGDMASL